LRGDRSPATVTSVSTSAEQVEQASDEPEAIPAGEPGADGDPGDGDAAGADAPPGLAPAEPEPEPAEPAEPSGKLVFVCQHCGKANDLMAEGAMVAEPQAHERYTTCPGCRGLGRVDSGSLVAGKGTLPCPDCGGAGYLDLSTPGQPPAEVEAQGEPPWPGAVYNGETGTWQ
jgi:hypothetical protein